jgi:UDP-N-acetylmuramate dehydrogenase
MIRFFENYSLKVHNTFGLDVKAKYFFEFTEPEDLQVFLNANNSWKEEKILILGEGSNLLFMNNFNGLVIYPNVPGIKSVWEDRQYEWLEVGCGEIWDEFVQYAVIEGLGGAENLSLIPGKVGAAPVQNIGAYGQEAGNLVEKVIGFDLKKGCQVEFSANECGFSYRNSIFKTNLKGNIIVTSVIFKLNKFPEFKLNYGNLKDKVKAKGEITLQNVRDAVIEIRSSKLPDTKELGSAGSFFKNPVVDKLLAKKLINEFENIPVYPAQDEKIKLAAGWLIEQSGWKGKRIGDAGVHESQALVLVNYGNASGNEIFDLSEKIKESVFNKFGVKLEREVNVID